MWLKTRCHLKENIHMPAEKTVLSDIKAMCCAHSHIRGSYHGRSRLCIWSASGASAPSSLLHKWNI